jgi:hypothetical protein
MLKVIIGLFIATVITTASTMSASAQSEPRDRSTATNSHTDSEPSYFRQAAGADQM